MERFEVAAGTDKEADAVEFFPELRSLVGIKSVFVQPNDEDPLQAWGGPSGMTAVAPCSAWEHGVTE